MGDGSSLEELFEVCAFDLLTNTAERYFVAALPAPIFILHSEVEGVVYQVFADHPEQLAMTTTLDNGSEHSQHEYIAAQTGIDIFFADAYASWQRGTNENTNGLIRWYFPKKTNFDEISEEDIQQIGDILNNRPRKCLGYRTPLEEGWWDGSVKIDVC